MAVSETTLKENYRQLSDEKLMRIAAEDAPRLRPEALALLREELRTRGLAEKSEQVIAAQFQIADPAIVRAYCALLQSLPCPICHSAVQPLNATLTSKVISFVVMTTWKKQFAIACPTCLDKLNRDASTTSALLGWWGFPWGIVRTIQALVANGKMAKNNHSPHPNELLQAFVVNNIGRIAAACDDTHHLQSLISTRQLS